MPESWEGKLIVWQNFFCPFYPDWQNPGIGFQSQPASPVFQFSQFATISALDFTFLYCLKCPSPFGENENSSSDITKAPFVNLQKALAPYINNYSITK